MKPSKRCYDLIKKYEGCHLTAYKCPANVWTIGYGHTKGVVGDTKITQKTANDFLEIDIQNSVNAVEKYNRIYNFSQEQFDSLVSFTFNCGVGNLNKLTNYGTRSTTTIGRKMLLYDKANGKPLKGLTNRRQEEFSLFNSTFLRMREIDVAYAVLLGRYGTGKERKEKITADGYNYANIQKLVNEILAERK